MKISYWNWMAMVLVMLLIRMAPAIGGVHLSEIMADPARDWDGDGTIDSRGDEWLEVYNSGPGTFDLADFYVRDALGDDPQLQLSGSLAPGAAAVFYGSDAEAWQQDAGFGVTGLSLNNGGDQVELWMGLPGGSGSTLLDIVIYPSHTGDDDRSVARIFPDDAWVLFDGLNPYGGELDPVGTGCDPSPGGVNECEGLVPAADASWGAVKKQYR